MTMKVGFIGLGIMGKPMSKNLLKAGYSLVVADRNPEAIADVIAAGAETASTAKAIAEQCDVIITMLPNSPHVKEVALGENGIIEGAKPGTVLIDMSSIAPLASREISEALKAKGIDMLDAPVSGGEPKAIDGTLSVMVGGDKAIFDKYYDLMKAMAGSVVVPDLLMMAMEKSLSSNSRHSSFQWRVLRLLPAKKIWGSPLPLPMLRLGPCSSSMAARGPR